jgi:hypothetical protein
MKLLQRHSSARRVIRHAAKKQWLVLSQPGMSQQ